LPQPQPFDFAQAKGAGAKPFDWLRASNLESAGGGQAGGASPTLHFEKWIPVPSTLLKTGFTGMTPDYDIRGQAYRVLRWRPPSRALWRINAGDG